MTCEYDEHEVNYDTHLKSIPKHLTDLSYKE